MPKQQAKTGLMGKLGGRLTSAVDTHKDDETTMPGGGQLPSGIENGIAQIVDCKFDVYKKGDNQGEFFFYAAATVIEPKMHGKIPIEGLRTQIGPEAVCDTPNAARKTLDEHVAWILNEMRKLGAETANLGADELETTAAAILEAAPYIRFRTWAGSKQVLTARNGKFYVADENGKNEKGPYASEKAANDANPYIGKEPKINHQWSGEVKDYQPDTSGAVVDETAATPPTDNGQKGAAKPTTKAKQKETPPEEVEPEAEAGEVDVEALVAAAEGGDEEAAKSLAQLAIDAGNSEETVTNAKDWQAVADLIMGSGEAVEGEGESEAPTGPEVDTICFYKVTVIDPRTKKLVKAKKATECKIVSVDNEKEMVTLKNMETGKTILGANKKPLQIKFDALEQGD